MDLSNTWKRIIHGLILILLHSVAKKVARTVKQQITPSFLV